MTFKMYFDRWLKVWKW